MRILQILLIISAIALGANRSAAQDNVTPEQIAKAETGQLHKMLNFTDGQYRRVYRALVSEARVLLEQKDGIFRGKKSGGLRAEFDNGKSPKVKLSGKDNGKLLDADFDTLDKIRTPENRDESRMRVEGKMKGILSDYQFALYLRYQKASEDKRAEEASMPAGEPESIPDDSIK